MDDGTATKESVETRVLQEIPNYIYLYPEFEDVDTYDSVTWTDYPGSIPTAQYDTNPNAIPGSHIKVDYQFTVDVTMDDGMTKSIAVIVTIEFE